MKRSDFLKRIGLAVGAIVALPAVALKEMRKPTLPDLNFLWPGSPPFIDFIKGTQWTPAQTKILEARRRYSLKINTIKIKAAKIPPKVEQHP